MKLSADVVSRLLHAQWTHGCCSDLRWTGLDAAAVLQLGNFTQIVALELGGNEFGVRAITSLVAASLPRLRDLSMP